MPFSSKNYELVYGAIWKELIQKKFCDGVMSANDFHFTIERQRDPKGG